MSMLQYGILGELAGLGLGYGVGKYLDPDPKPGELELSTIAAPAGALLGGLAGLGYGAYKGVHHKPNTALAAGIVAGSSLYPVVS